jgi:ABC-type antimicrobial peptide transport system permease subunit
MATLGAGGAIADSGFAQAHHLSVGSPISLETPAGRTIRLRVAAVYDPPQAGNPLATVSISARTFDAHYRNPENVFTLIATPGGVTAANTAALNRVLAAFPDAKLQTEQQFLSSQEASIQSELNLIYILLALSIVVSLFGIVNTLVLTVFERTRELGMLRAVGMTRRQVRRMIRYESVITALIGAAIGIALGIVLAVLLIARVDFITLSWPITSLVVFALVGVVAGLIAAILPARRASRLNVLEALQYE